MISKQKEMLNSMILIQQNLVKILLDYIEKIVNSSNDVDTNSADDIVKILEDLKKSLNYCNENIASLQKASSCEDDPIETILLVNTNTTFVEDFLYSLLPFTELKFSKTDETSKNIITEDIEVTTTDEIKQKENTLIISETTGKVILPYYISELENIKSNSENKTYEEIIQENYTLPLEQFKTPFVARFREAFRLVHSKEQRSVKAAFDLGTELIFNYNLHPAIIAACRNLDELDIYLDYLESNETEKFDCFNIIFEIPPVISKRKSSKYDF